MTNEAYTRDIQFWKTEEILKLANHFHHFSNGQHARVHYFEMTEDLVVQFRQLGTIESMVIRLAIKTAEKDINFTFYPILEVTAPALVGKAYFPLEAMPLGEDSSRADFVPGIFKDMIQDNWDKIDITYIDDLFIAQDQISDGKLLNRMVRVHSFLIDDDIVDFINDVNVHAEVSEGVMKPNIQEIKLYPGVDMNKFGKKEFISFAPVLGFTHLTDSLQAHSRTGLIEVEKNETFIEYMFPCPPTCKKGEPGI